MFDLPLSIIWPISLGLAEACLFIMSFSAWPRILKDFLEAA